MINPKTSKRFIMETGNRKVRADAIVAIGEPAVIYTNETNFMNKVVGKNMKQEQFETALKNGVIRKFDDLKSLADFYKLDYAVLEKENEKFNGYMKAMKDPEFNCMFFKDGVPNDKGPFYAIRLVAARPPHNGWIGNQRKRTGSERQRSADCRSLCSR